MLIDPFGRPITYLRVSVTDRCNLRCAYCMPPEGVQALPRQEFLTFEETTRIVRIAIRLGMTGIRITGGEPLVRCDIERLLAMLGSLEGLSDFALSTSGVLLEEKAAALHESGIRRINMSLNTLRAEKFRQISHRDEHARALAGLAAIGKLPFKKIKINMVVIRGFNDDEILDFARMTLRHPYTVRFIELMPIGQVNFWKREKVVPVREIRERLEVLGTLQPVEKSSQGPQRLFRLPGAPGEIGFITPVSDEFCAACNRLRLTADGKLRGCLLSAGEVDLRQPLRQGISDLELEDLFRLAVARKPEKHYINDPERFNLSERFMSQMGG